MFLHSHSGHVSVYADFLPELCTSGGGVRLRWLPVLLCRLQSRRCSCTRCRIKWLASSVLSYRKYFKFHYLIVHSALSYSSDCSDSNLLQGEALANSNNMRMSSGSVGTFELARAQDAVGLHDIVASIPSLSQKGSTISENSLSVAGTKRDSPKTISLFRIFPTVDTSDSSDSDNENETAPPNSMQTKVIHL